MQLQPQHWINCTLVAFKGVKLIANLSNGDRINCTLVAFKDTWIECTKGYLHLD